MRPRNRHPLALCFKAEIMQNPPYAQAYIPVTTGKFQTAICHATAYNVNEDRPCPSDYKLLAANRSHIVTYGLRYLNLNIGLRRPFSWHFIVADVPSGIIGMDFLEHHGLTLDLRSKRLIDPITKLVRGHPRFP